MEIIDFIIAIPVLAFVLRLMWYVFTSHPSDKYHNDSWRDRDK